MEFEKYVTEKLNIIDKKVDKFTDRQDKFILKLGKLEMGVRTLWGIVMACIAGLIGLVSQLIKG